MSREVAKSVTRRGFDSRYAIRWFTGNAIDIGAGGDSLANHVRYFPLLRSVREWDKPDGDAMLMDGIPDEEYDIVHSSHCLEHLEDPQIAIRNWIRICRRGGHLVIVVPDEDLYEQGIFPSTFAPEHKWTFTIGKNKSWCDKSINLIDLLGNVVDQVKILKMELLDTSFVYGAPRIDQTLGSAESAIEIILQKL